MRLVLNKPCDFKMLGGGGGDAELKLNFSAISIEKFFYRMTVFMVNLKSHRAERVVHYGVIYYYGVYKIKFQINILN